MARTRAIPVILSAALLLPAAGGTLPAQEKPAPTRLTVNHYLDWENVGDPQLSPDGSRVLYTREWVNQLKDSWESALWLMRSDGSHNRFLAQGAGARWSPDGTRIAYVAEGDPSGKQVFVRWMDGEGAVSQITRVAETPSNLRWSPDGRTVAFTMNTPRAEAWKIDMPAAPKGA